MSRVFVCHHHSTFRRHCHPPSSIVLSSHYLLSHTFCIRCFLFHGLFIQSFHHLLVSSFSTFFFDSIPGPTDVWRLRVFLHGKMCFCFFLVSNYVLRNAMGNDDAKKRKTNPKEGDEERETEKKKMKNELWMLNSKLRKMKIKWKIRRLTLCAECQKRLICYEANSEYFRFCFLVSANLVRWFAHFVFSVTSHSHPSLIRMVELRHDGNNRKAHDADAAVIVVRVSLFILGHNLFMGLWSHVAYATPRTKWQRDKLGDV